MNDNQIDVRVTANASGLQAGMGAAASSVAQSGQRMRAALDGLRQRFSSVGKEWGVTTQAMSAQMGKVAESVSSSVVGMGGHFSSLISAISSTKAGMVALVGVGAALAASKAVEATAKMTEKTMDLARVMGVSTNEAQLWRVALEDVGGSQEDLQGAARGMSRQLKENEDAMNSMGLATRDAAGNLRPMNELLSDGLEVLNGYKEGADRSLASQQLFGRGVDASSKLLLVNKTALSDAAQTVEDLGLQVGENAVAAWKEYDAATDRAGFSLQGLVKTVGASVMPVFSDLINMFNAVMPAAIVVVRGAVGGLASAFHLVRNGVVVLFETINALVVTVAEPIRALGEAIGRALVGDFTGAASAIKGIGGVISGAWSTAMNNMVASSQRTRDRIDAIFSPDLALGEPEGTRGKKTFTPPPKKGEAAKEESAIPALELQLLTEKQGFAQRDALHEFAKTSERDFWANILNTVELSGKDRIAVQRKIATLEVDILREKARETQQLDAIGRASFRDSELAKVEQEQQTAQQAVALGQSTKAELLVQEEGFEQRRFEIRRQALEASLAVLDPTRDPVQVAQVNEQLEQLEQQHQLALGAIRGQAAVEAQQQSLQLAGTLQSGFASVIARIGTSITSIGGFVKSMLSVVVGTFVQMLAQMAAKWLVTKLLMKAISKATALGEISAEAGKAGAGGVASMAAAPFPINLGAPAFGAAMSALAFGFAPLASASQGFDIPAGLAPITQLHPREMVLPEKQADVIRDLADGDGAGQAPIVFKGASAGDFFIAHKSELAKVMKSMRRNFEFQ